MKKLFTRVVRTALLAMCALMALPASADKTLYLQNDGGWTTIQVWAWGGDPTNVFSGDYDARPDILKFDSSKVNTGRTFTVTKGKVGDNDVYKIVVDDSCTDIRFGTATSGSLTNFNNKIYKTQAQSLTDFSGTWTDGDVVTIPAALYVCGNINGSSDWDNTTPVSMTQNGNVFSIPSVNVSGSTNNYVGFTTDNTKPNSADTRYGLSTGGTEIADFTKSYELTLKGYGFKLAEGNYSLKVDFTDSSKPIMTIAKAGTTEQVKTPEITQNGNQVSISCETTDAVIYYTLDGNAPSESSTKYEQAFPITANCTVKAIAIKEGMDNSTVAEKAVTYTAPTADVPSSFTLIGKLETTDWDDTGKAMSKDGNIFSLQNVKISNEFKFRGTIGTNTTDYGTKEDNDTYKKIDVANLPFTADVVKGKGSTWVVSAAGTYNISVDFSNADAPILTLSGTSTQQQVKTPVIEQQGNKVFITCETEGATIYCSLNGNDPEINDDYKYDAANGVGITANCTVKAIAVKEGMANSAVAEKAVTYNNCFTPGTYYVKPNAGFWGDDKGRAELKVNIGGENISPERIPGTDYYAFTIDADNVSKVKLIRHNANNLTEIWASAEVAPENGKNTIEITNEEYFAVPTLYTNWTIYEAGTVPDELYLWYRKWEGENPEENARICVKLQKEGNKFTTTEPVHNYKYVIFSTSGTSFEAEDATNYGYATAEYTPPTLDNPVALTLGGEMFNATMGNLSFVVDFTSAARPTVLITPEMPHHLSIVGNIDGTENWESGKELKAVSKSFTLQDVQIDGDFAFINPITKIKYGARANRVLPFEENEVGVTADGNLRRRSEYKWQLAAGDKGDTYDITVDFTNSRNPSLLVKKHVDAITAPAQLYIIGTDIGNLDDATTAMPMTKSGNTYYYNVENYAAGTEGEFRILSKRGTEANDWSMEQYEALTNGEDFPLNGYKVFNVRPEGNGKGFNWKFKDDNDGTYRIEINFTTRRVHISFSEGKANNKYFLVGDVNKWLNDGTYTYSIKDENGNYLDADGNIVANENQAATRIVSYGYDVNVHGERDAWELKEVPEDERIPRFMSDGETWYKLKMPLYGDVEKALYGQFLIYQGAWNKAVWKDNKTIYHTVNWDGSYKKWSNTVDTDAAEYLKTEAGIAPETVFNCGNKSGNLKLQHNYYYNATVYFTPTSDDAGKIYVAVEDPENDVKDIYVYYANSNAKDTDRPVIKANNSSINSNNYKLDVVLFNKEMEKVDGTLETKDGMTYSPYWRQKVRPGMECPSGQKITVTLSGATGVSSSNWATINIDDIYFLDGIHVFAQPNASEINVSKIEFRIYGYSLDGSEIVVSKPDGTGAAPDEPTGDLNWTDMNRGNILNTNISSSHDLTDKWVTNPNGQDWGSQHTSIDLNHEISPSQATKYIQFRVTYTEIVQTPDGMRRVAGERTEVVPNYFALDKSDPSASWVLNGTHKLYTPGIETGVEDIFGDEFTEDGEEVETIYYNLQGQRVDNPDKGLYIRVRGTKTDKVLF